MASKAQTDERRSILLAAIGAYAAKSIDKSVLVEGLSVDVAATIDGRVGRAAIEFDLAGTVHVGHRQQFTRNVAPDPSIVLAAVLAEIPSDERARIIAKVEKGYDAGKISKNKADHVAAAKALLSALKTTEGSSRAGSVAFHPVDKAAA